MPPFHGAARSAVRQWRPALVLVVAGLTVASSACTSAKSGGSDADAIRGALPGVRTSTASNSAWTTLFDGTSLSGWHNYPTPGAPVTGWSAEDGTLVRTGRGGDLTTDRQYANFELELEWKVGPGGNSGIIYRIDHAGERSYTSGPELQILDDAVHVDGKNPLTSAGANYALHAPTPGVVKPANEWNSVRLLVNGAHVEHWMNGVKVVEYELGSADWEARRQTSKFANAPRYGRAARGHIALQDHGDRVFFRNIRIRELP